MEDQQDLCRAILDADMRRQRAEAELVHLVHEARELNVSWTTIGTLLGITMQGAKQRYETRPQAKAAAD